MRYKEFKEKVGGWGRKHGYVTKVVIRESWTYIKVESNGMRYFIADISNENRCAIDTDWIHFNKIGEHARAELFDIIVEFAKTPPENRERQENQSGEGSSGLEKVIYTMVQNTERSEQGIIEAMAKYLKQKLNL